MDSGTPFSRRRLTLGTTKVSSLTIRIAEYRLIAVIVFSLVPSKFLKKTKDGIIWFFKLLSKIRGFLDKTVAMSEVVKPLDWKNSNLGKRVF